MSVLYVVLALVAAQRIVELCYARRNTRALLARGGVETARAQHPWFVTLHAAWLLAMLVFVPARTPPDWWLLGAFALLQGARIWVIASLGPYWTTRLITLPGAPLVRRGPYRLLRHPNYAIVALEIAALPLAFGAWIIALVFSAANAALLTWRIKAEDAALAPRRSLTTEREMLR
jgi:methyltransferase